MATYLEELEGVLSVLEEGDGLDAVGGGVEHQQVVEVRDGGDVLDFVLRQVQVLDVLVGVQQFSKVLDGGLLLLESQSTESVRAAV